MLSHSLQNTMRALATFPGHGQPQNTPCRLYRKVAELNDLLRENDPCYYSSSSYDRLSATPTDSELLTPQSVTSSYRNHDSPIIEGLTAESAHHGVYVGSSRPTDWNFDPYFGSVVVAQDTNGYPSI
jgi:hypothetical protein